MGQVHADCKESEEGEPRHYVPHLACTTAIVVSNMCFIRLQLSILLRDSTYAHFSKLDLAGEVVHLQ